MNKLVALVVCALVGCGVEERADSLLGPQDGADSGFVPDASAQIADASSREIADQDASAADASSAPADSAADSGVPQSERLVSQAELLHVLTARCESCHAIDSVRAKYTEPLLGEWGDAGQYFLPHVGEASKCAGWDYAVPGHPEQSLLYMKLTAAAPCGAHPAMPMPPSADEVEMIGDAMRSWGADGGF